jgi:DNA-binding NtrC family response regulator
VIAASNQPLEAEIEAGRFREDLFWRLKVIAVELPPLRERPADVVELAEHFLKQFAERYDKRLEGLEPDCLALLVGHSWAGNVRELENTIERAVLLSHGQRLHSCDLGEDFAPLQEGGSEDMGLLIGLQNLRELPPLKKALEGPERAILRRALELCGGSRKKTAQMLGLNRTTLFNKMRKYGLMEVSAATPHGPTAPTSSSTNGTPDRAPAGGQDRESA